VLYEKETVRERQRVSMYVWKRVCQSERVLSEGHWGEMKEFRD